jgi:hypothetical protein
MTAGTQDCYQGQKGKGDYVLSHDVLFTGCVAMIV